MGPSARREYVARMKAMYHAVRGRGSKKERGRLLGQVCEVLKRSRITAKRLMRVCPPAVDKPPRRRGATYPQRLIGILASVWEAAQCPWSVRLKAVLPLWMRRIKQRWALTPAEVKLLLKMSPATMDRRLVPRKKELGRRIYGQTKPGKWLRQTIPIQTDSSGVKEPGWIEADTVSHSGPNAAGLFAYTLNETDLFSGWDEACAILGKQAEKVVAASDEIREAFPFEEKGKDTDNGEEFINYEMDRYCHRMGIKRFRSRPYKKNDQAHVEQKNGTHVRRPMGYHRYDTQAAVDAMNDLYRNEWRILTNLFLPSIKLNYKTRRGSKIKRVYHPPMTPLDRLLKSEFGDRTKLEQFRQLRERLDPFELSKTVDRKLQAIWKLASHGPIKPAPTPYVPTRAKRPWEHWMAHEDAKLAQLPFQAAPDLLRISRNYWRDTFFGTN